MCVFSLCNWEGYIVIIMVPNKENIINIHICSMQWIGSYNENTHIEIIYTFPLSLIGFFIQSDKISTFSLKMM